MKVVAINGSARKNGNTDILIKAVFEELNKEGIETELIELAGQETSKTPEVATPQDTTTPMENTEDGDEKVGQFDFETKTVLLNSGYEMPIMGLGTYSLDHDTCVSSVKALLENGGRLIDTAYMYGNEDAVGEGVRQAMEEYGIPREDIFDFELTDEEMERISQLDRNEKHDWY